MPLRKPLAALLLLAAAALPQWLWMGAHALEHQSHTAHSEHRPWADLAQTLLHGHHHEDGVPDHQHLLQLHVPLRPDAPRDLQAPAASSPDLVETGPLLPTAASPWRERVRIAGDSPPRLHLLCTLLI